MAITPTPPSPPRHPVRGQAAELLDLLRRFPMTGLTRLEMFRRGRPALGLNSPNLLGQLRRAGYQIDCRWEEGLDTHGHTVRFLRYWLR